MSDHPPFRKVFEGVATQEQMFQLFDRHRDTPGNDPLSGAPYDGEWFELQGSTYHFMLDLLPPLFMRTGMFGLSEYKAGYVTSVFFAIRIRGRERWFHGFCNLANRRSPDAMRAAIIAYETGASDSMTRAEKLEAIWNTMPAEFKEIGGDRNPDAFAADQHGRRTVLIDTGGPRPIPKPLEDLSDAEIEELLAVSQMRRKSRS
ncbi:DUF1419 domain-containing protein [Mesorhizobium sp. L-2-11]|uniref:DUF1419 domain-containing protein n=1 Tax=Mesorhizobium sp. L-2-11 TaxID=2744521 RepID=UPI0018EB4C15|nr:DUF1419 domain-containing protein [Mesorhizobium sp. L-2-11]BCH19903.1 hypothetical protein MesoLjLa_67540 [Mesorhizobium sp. L-2-11]